MRNAELVRPGLFCALALAAFASAHGASVPGGEVTVREDVSYLAPDRTEKLDLYLPPGWSAQARGPALVWIHGGGWTGGAKGAPREENVCRTLAAKGYVCASIDYRLGDGAWPQNLLDCKNGVRYLKAHATEHGIDPARIAVAGGSAGGHLALMVGLTAGKPEFEPQAPYPGVSSTVTCIIDFYGPANLMNRQEVNKDGTPTGQRRLGGPASVYGTSSMDAEVFKIASPVNHIHAKSPPVLILHGRADGTVDYRQSEELARVLKKHGVPHEFVLLDRVGHTFDLHTWAKKPMPRSVEPDVLKFLAKHNGER